MILDSGYFFGPPV